MQVFLPVFPLTWKMQLGAEKMCKSLCMLS